MIPFRVPFQAGVPLCDQVVYAAKKAIISGQMRIGDPFPSVRLLSKALKINPNTAHKVIVNLTDEGLIEVKPGIGTVVAVAGKASAAERSNLLRTEMEHLVVEAKKLGLSLDDLSAALERHWGQLQGAKR